MATIRHSTRPATSTDSSILTLELRTEPGVYAYDLWQNISIGVYVGQATLTAVRRLNDMSREMSQRYPDGRSSVVFVLDQLLGPTPEAQVEMKRVVESEGLACMCIVIEGTGFWASGIRSMANNVKREVTTGVQHRVFTTIDEVVTWMPPLHRDMTGVVLDPSEFRRALASVRQKGAVRALAAK